MFVLQKLFPQAATASVSRSYQGWAAFQVKERSPRISNDGVTRLGNAAGSPDDIDFPGAGALFYFCRREISSGTRQLVART
jgi:hypothetical protein